MQPSKSPELDVIFRTARDRRLDRRSFMQAALAAGVSLAAASALWSKTTLAAPAKGGLFRVGLDDGNTTDSMDPATTSSRFMITMAHTQRNFLTEIAPNNEVAGELSESWETSGDAKTWMLKLRKGVEFHNGKTFDANDVVASLNHHRGDKSTSGAKSLLTTVESIEADDKNTVIVKLSSGNADLPYLLTDYHLVMLPADGEGKVSFANDAGTGGYMVKSFDPGVKATLERFKNYWKADSAYFDAVEYTAIPDVNARQTGLLNNSLDAMIECDFKTIHMLGRDSNLKVDEVPTGTHVSMPMHMDVAPFDNPDVRLALKYAVDRDATVKVVVNGHGSIGNDHPISPIMPYYDASIPQRSYDPEKAKFHLKKAGLANLKIDLSAADAVITSGVDMALLFQETARPM